MALPNTGQSWPPQQLTKILPQLGLWSAWYAGDGDMLSSVYGGAQGSDPSATGFFASDHGGFRATVGRALTRTFWGEATRGPDRKTKLHIPLAAELCQTSADLLFADEVTLTVDDKPTQARLDELAGDYLHSEFAEAAEVCAALGGVYLRVTWDAKIAPDGPFITHVDSDQAIPEFRWGRLQAVTFWQVVARDGKTVYRHLERHELNAAGDGIILHGLYQGEEDKLGHPVPLTDQSATAPLAPLVDAFGTISTESPGLAVVYVPNQTPNRKWRTDPLGANLGRSDLDGVEQLLDALDETYSSLMRDIRLGKARIMVAKSLLDNVGPGNGRAFDANQEVYSPINTLAGKDQPLAQQIEQVQFKIRFQEHHAVITNLIQRIIEMVGYSSESFGIYDGGGPIRTATEVESKVQRSLMTRDRKIRLWRPAIVALVEKLLAVDAAIFGKPNNVGDGVDVAFADGVQESQLSLAQTAQLLSAADVASKETIVGMLHPDWDKDLIDEEVARIKVEHQTVTDPMNINWQQGDTYGSTPDPGTGGAAANGGGAGG